MSGLEVVGAISAILGILDISYKTWQSVEKDSKLPETFKVVARKLPILHDTLKTCEDKLRPIENSIDAATRKAFKETLEHTEEQAEQLQSIFKKTLSESSDSAFEQYKKLVKRLGKGKKVEELMKSMSEDVKQVVDYVASKCAQPEMSKTLDTLVTELQDLPSSIPEDPLPGYSFNNYGGGKQQNNTGSGQILDVKDGNHTFNFGQQKSP